MTTRPTSGTPEYDLWVAALEIVHAAPLKRNNATTFAAQIPWSRIDKLRAALDAVGIDWADHHPANQR